MNSTGLPPDIRGEWIWRADSLNAVDGYVLFRHEFMITEAPGAAELWIAAHTRYQLYINGRHFCRGQSPASGLDSYVSYFDVSFCMEIGKNVICVVAHDTRVSRFANKRRESGIWCQLDLDQNPTAWTDTAWKAMQGEAFLTNQPRTSLAGSFVETLDFRKYPHGWKEVNFQTDDWDNADYSVPIEDSLSKLISTPDFEPQAEVVELDFVSARGTAEQVSATTHVSVGRQTKAQGGLYACESFVQAEQAGEFSLRVFSDDPYHIFVNEKLAKSQGHGDPTLWVDPTWNPPRNYMQDELADTDAAIYLEDGWNKVTIVMQVAPSSSGVTLVFPELPAKTKFNRGTDAFSLPGWNVAGPLQVPFANVTGSINIDRLPQTTYHAVNPCDSSAHLAAFAFHLTEQYDMREMDEYEGTENLDLESGDYVIYTLLEYARGCPEFRVKGSAGDVIDVVFGEHVINGQVRSYLHDRRHIYTIILDSKEEVQWQAMTPNGMKHVMVVVRHATGRVAIRDINVRCMKFSFHEPGAFSCADELLNQIWENSVRTLNCTYDYVFLNAGGNADGQLLADAMIQALASISVFGSFDPSEKALREFAAAQFETGEIPAIAPSDYVVRLYDFALLWPIWLQIHIYYSDDRQLAEDMLPVLQQLLTFFESIVIEEELIANLDSPYVIPGLLDYDPNVDCRGVSTGLNALYALALLKSRWIFDYMGQTELAEICLARANNVASRLRELTWNEEKGLFSDCWYDGAPSDSYSFQSNVLALYAGIARHANHEPLFNTMFMDYAPFIQLQLDEASDNAYFKYFVLDMAYALNFRDWAIDFMRYYWGKMVQQGARTWWERFCPNVEFDDQDTPSLCHGYGVSPVFFIMREVVGIRPVTAGYLQVYFNPLLTVAEWVRAQIPTPQGVIMVDWAYNESGELEIVIESNYPLEVVPLLDKNIAASAIFHVNDSVAILQLEEGDTGATDKDTKKKEKGGGKEKKK
jgi:hypothetical protein